MSGGYERRRYTRLPISLVLNVNKVYNQKEIILGEKDARIGVFDISKQGIGFVSDVVFPKDYYFDAKIQLSEKDYIYAVIKIVRISEARDGVKKEYGAEFVGLAPFLAAKIDDYEKKIKGQY